MPLTERELLIAEVSAALTRAQTAIHAPSMPLRDAREIVAAEKQLRREHTVAKPHKARASAKPTVYPKVTGTPPKPRGRATMPAPAPAHDSLVNEQNVLEAIAQHDGGATIGQIATVLASTPDAVRPTLHGLAKASQLIVTGVARGTRYSRVMGAPALPVTEELHANGQTSAE